jgi:hypothetical protein
MSMGNPSMESCEAAMLAQLAIGSQHTQRVRTAIVLAAQ